MATESEQKNPEKSPIAQREEEILAFWKEKNIFQKSLKKDSPKGNFVFYDGPPFATGLPHYGHMLPGTIKDVIPRYKTMQGYHVPRRWGWDCHGLPVENLIEKELGLKNKKDIEELGIEKFNDAARASVLRYDADWKKIVPRSGRWIDMDNAYLTMDWKYSESIWWSFKNLHDKNLIYQGYKVMPYCPHCGTTLSNFEVTQGYKDISDLSVYAAFELIDEPGTSVIAWTTTPWTLPGNVALAINADIEYVEIRAEYGEKVLNYIVAKDLSQKIIDKLQGFKPEVTKSFIGKELVGKRYKQVFDYYQNADFKNKENAWKIVAADFVTTTDGTGVVHIAPAFGEDDYKLSLKENLPVIHHIDTEGKFKKEAVDFAGQYAKPKEDPQKGDVEIIKYLAKQGTLFAKEKIVHSYPHCWRCDTPLLNYATSSWFVKVTDFKDKLIEENNKVGWNPKEIGEGRFGKWLENARDWAISRSRYWGAPLPVWMCKECNATEIIGSVHDIKQKTKRNNYLMMRHGEADHNVENVVRSRIDDPDHLTDTGKAVVAASAELLKDKKIDLIIASPLVRTKKTADIVREHIGFDVPVTYDDRLREFDFGDYNGKSIEEYHRYFTSVSEKLVKRMPNGENILDVRKRIGEFLYEIDQKYSGKNILLVTHDSPASLLLCVAEGGDEKRLAEIWSYDTDSINPGEVLPLDFSYIPHNKEYELDLHRPYIDDVIFKCDKCGHDMKRIPEVFDTWYESGSMPYSQIHYPFENKEKIDEHKAFPADVIAEGQDQTRGWFYSLLVLSTGLFQKSPYKNVVVNGIILAEDGQKMSKKLKNYPELSLVFDKYGADALRYYMLSSPAVRAEDLMFSEKGLDEVAKKIIGRLQNVYTFYETYRKEKNTDQKINSKNILDQWIFARLNQVIDDVTTGLEEYQLDKASRPLLLFIDDLSTWYLRRSRDRFKGDDAEDKQAALATTEYVLVTLSKLLAPFMPFLAEDLYLKMNGGLESVHLDTWPQGDDIDLDVLTDMEKVRMIVTLGLEARASKKIKVRQPLSTFTMGREFAQEFITIIKDELNVKEVVVDQKLVTEQEEKVILNDTITPELKLEGQAREFMRAVQDLRKKSGLNPTDVVILNISTDKVGKDLIEKFKQEIMKTAQVKTINFVEADSKTDSPNYEQIKIDELAFALTVVK